MNNKELQDFLKQYPDDAIVGTPYGVGRSFKSVSYLTSHKAHIVKDKKIIGETELIHIHNDDCMEQMEEQ